MAPQHDVVLTPCKPARGLCSRRVPGTTTSPVAASAAIAAFGDYNEHFIQDIRSAYLAFGALLVWAAIALHKEAITAALLGFLVFAVSHFAIHVFVREGLSTNGYVGTLAILGIGIALSVWLLFLSRKLTST